MKSTQEACKVSIFGEQYTVLSDEPIDRILKAAALVDSMMRENAEAGNFDTKRAAVLIALRLANLTVSKDDEKELAQKRAQDILNNIDLELALLGCSLPQ